MRDAYSILSVLATQTNSLQLATGVTHTVTRHPAVLANSWATLQELSEGRAICGIGVGESAVHNLGLRPERLAAFEEKVKVMRALINGETVEGSGTLNDGDVIKLGDSELLFRALDPDSQPRYREPSEPRRPRSL